MNKRSGMLYFILNNDVLACLVAHNLEGGEWVAQIPFFPPAQPVTGVCLSLSVCGERGGGGGREVQFMHVCVHIFGAFACEVKNGDMASMPDRFQRTRVPRLSSRVHRKSCKHHRYEYINQHKQNYFSV
jgi:hypothetical protein